MRRYIADLHFFHENLNDSMDCRGFASAAEMNEYMIRQWNSKVRKNDEVVILGDFSVGKAEDTKKVLDRLNGRLYFISGNHDYFLHDRSFDTSRFCWVKPYAEMHDNGRKVILSHYPIFCYNGQYRRTKKGDARTYMLYGHVHDTVDEQLIRRSQQITRETDRADGDGKIDCNMLNCFCKYSDYVPWTLDEWIAFHAKHQTTPASRCACEESTCRGQED